MLGQPFRMKARALRSVAAFVALVCFGLLLAHLIRAHMHPDFWWIGLILSHLVVATFRLDALLPARQWKDIGPERVALNLEAQLLLQQNHSNISNQTTAQSFEGRHILQAQALQRLQSVTSLPLPPPFLRALPLLCLLGLVFLPGLIGEVDQFSKRLAHALEPARLHVEIEPPAYSSEPATRAQLGKGGNLSLRVVSGSYLKLRTTGGRGLKALFEKEQNSAEPQEISARGSITEAAASLSATIKEQDARKNLENNYHAAFARNQGWSGSTGLLSDALNLDPNKPASVTLNIALEQPATAQTDGPSPDFQIHLQIDPKPIPLVTLAVAAEHQAAGRQPAGEAAPSDEFDESQIVFALRAESKIPLTQVELLVRTASGYKFNMPVGEFAGTDRLSFESQAVTLQTVGIPFTENDTLYVQARAQSVVKELAGYSKELSFKVKSPIQTRKELIAQLEKILEKLQTAPQASAPKFDEFASELESKLGEAVATAQELGKQSAPARNLEDARKMAATLPRNHEAGRELSKIGSRVEDTLQTLKRRQAQEQASSWFLKTKSYLDKLARAETVSQELLQEAETLQDESEKLKQGLAELLDSPSSGLKPEEKQLAVALLEKDQTPERMQGLKEQLASGKKETAVTEGQNTLAHATQGLGAILQLVNVARARQIKEAKEKLSQADEALESTRQSSQKQDQQRAANQAQQNINSTPQLGDAFNKALDQAKAGVAGVNQALRQGGSPALLNELDKTQQAIADALAALDQEEQASREERGEEEGRRFRSALDALNAQGQLDSGWRKKIFEEISRLREKGVPADADIIRYLESRLR